jgi:hypothetical protein
MYDVLGSAYTITFRMPRDRHYKSFSCGDTVEAEQEIENVKRWYPAIIVDIQKAVFRLMLTNTGRMCNIEAHLVRKKGGKCDKEQSARKESSELRKLVRAAIGKDADIGASGPAFESLTVACENHDNCRQIASIIAGKLKDYAGKKHTRVLKALEASKHILANCVDSFCVGEFKQHLDVFRIAAAGDGKAKSTAGKSALRQIGRLGPIVVGMLTRHANLGTERKRKGEEISSKLSSFTFSGPAGWEAAGSNTTEAKTTQTLSQAQVNNTPLVVSSEFDEFFSSRGGKTEAPNSGSQELDLNSLFGGNVVNSNTIAQKKGPKQIEKAPELWGTDFVDLDLSKTKKVPQVSKKTTMAELKGEEIDWSAAKNEPTVAEENDDDWASFD